MKTTAGQRKNRAQDPLAQLLGKRLRVLRKERGWTQTELAKTLGIHFTIVGYYERGTHYPPLPMLKQLADAYHVTIDELVGSGAGSAPSSFQDRELLEFFLRADKLDHKTRSTIKDVLEGVLIKAEMDKPGPRQNTRS